MDRKERLWAFLREHPEDLFTRHALAMEYIKEGDDGQARELLEWVLAKDSAYIGSYYHLGKLLERQGDHSAAEAVYRRGIEAAGKAGDHHAMGELNTALILLD